MAYWEYATLTRLSSGLDTKWYVNRIYQHSDNALPEEVTDKAYRALNDKFDALHATKVFPILPAVLNLMGAAGWELIDDMQTGITGGEGLVFKRTIARPRPAAKRAAKQSSAKRARR